MLFIEAHKLGASDIHLERLDKKFRVRFRIDGVLQEMQAPPKRLQSAIISRLKIMTGSMSIAEKRLPQDGRIQVKIKKKPIDLRVSTIPTNHGEGVVMRLLDKSSLKLGLPELGFFSDDQETFERLIKLPDGILLVTGPTGSGKTTSLYACLNYINKPDRKIITVEEPVEYQMTGINQVQVNTEIGMTFPAALRSILRQAPNIIMIGEIRDLETASIATNASLTGHLVFSTLHTNDAPAAVARLVDLGVQPFLVASSVRAIMAQRLVRRLCAHCKQPAEFFVEQRVLEPSQAEDVLREVELNGKTVVQAMTDGGFIDEGSFYQAIANGLGTDFVDLTERDIAPAILRLIPSGLARLHGALPVEMSGTTFRVALIDPFDLQVAEDLRFALGKDIQVVVSPEHQIEDLIKQHYGSDTTSMEDVLKQLGQAGELLSVSSGREGDGEAAVEAEANATPIIRFVDLILYQAIQDRASDIHFEPFENEFKIRYRVDGALYEMAPPPRHLALPVISRVKVMANMNIAERRLP